MTPIVSMALTAVQAPAAAAPLPAAAPDPAAATRFSSLMAGPALPPDDPAPVARAVAQAWPASGGLGERILHGLNRVQGGFSDTVAMVTRSLDASGPAPGMQEMLRLQMAMAQLSVQVELAGKAIGRSTQNIDQLVRMQ